MFMTWHCVHETRRCIVACTTRAMVVCVSCVQAERNRSVTRQPRQSRQACWGARRQLVVKVYQFCSGLYQTRSWCFVDVRGYCLEVSTDTVPRVGCISDLFHAGPLIDEKWSGVERRKVTYFRSLTQCSNKGTTDTKAECNKVQH